MCIDESGLNVSFADARHRFWRHCDISITCVIERDIERVFV